MGRRGAPRGRPDADRGAAAVEFALVSLPLFLVLFGIIQYGFLFYQVIGATSAAQDAATSYARGIQDCDTWRSWSLGRAHSNGVGDALGPTVTAQVSQFDSADGEVRVTLGFRPNKIVPLVPVPDIVTRTAVATLENVPAGGVTAGCL